MFAALDEAHDYTCHLYFIPSYVLHCAASTIFLLYDDSISVIVSERLRKITLYHFVRYPYSGAPLSEVLSVDHAQAGHLFKLYLTSYFILIIPLPSPNLLLHFYAPALSFMFIYSDLRESGMKRTLKTGS